MAGLRLKAARVALAMRQESLANAVGVGRTALANWESGRMPDVHAMIRLNERFGIPLEWIYEGRLRTVPFDLAERLQAACAEVGAVVGAPAAEWPMQVERQPGVARLKAAARVPHQRPARPRTLHESAQKPTPQE